MAAVFRTAQGCTKNSGAGERGKSTRQTTRTGGNLLHKHAG